MDAKSLDLTKIRQLWMLRAVLAQGSFKKAAYNLGVSSSAVSQAVTALEQGLNRRLLVRKDDDFAPTEFGENLLKTAQAAFDALDELQRRFGHTQPGPAINSLTFGTTASLAIDVLPGLVERLRTLCPGIRISVRVGRSSLLSQAVKKGELSMALVAEHEGNEDLDVIKIAEERMAFYCSSRPEIAKQGWALVNSLGVGAFPADRGGYTSYFRGLFRPFGTKWVPALTSESYEALRALAVSGSMVAALSTRVAAIDRGDLIEVKPPSDKWPDNAGRYNICLISDRSVDPPQVEFLAEQLKLILSHT